MSFIDNLKNQFKPNIISIYIFIIVLSITIIFFGPFISEIGILLLIIYSYIYSSHLNKKIRDKKIKRVKETLNDFIYWYITPILLVLLLYSLL